MSDAVNRFYRSISGADKLSQSDKISFFVYYITVELGNETATSAEINHCFEQCDLEIPANTSARLKDGLRSKPKKYLRKGKGYKLHREKREAISKMLGAEVLVTQTSATLRDLEDKIPEGQMRTFLSETIDCFEVNSNRATIVMAWCLTIAHLQSFILSKRISEFNSVLAANNDKRVKIKKVQHYDDFSAIPEGKFIEFCKSAGIISNDVCKILDAKLGIRNSAAHPSAVTFGKAKTIDFVEDLIENVVLKFQV